MAFDEDHLVCDAMKQIGQAFATVCLVVTKMKSWRVAEDLKAQDELHKKIKRLKNKVKLSNNLQQEAERLRAEKAKEAAK